MKHGHVVGTRRQRPAQSDWYAAIEQATLAALDATWPNDNPAPQEVTSAITQAAGTTHQAQTAGTKQHA